MSFDVESAIDGLYQVPLDRFTAERNALAAALKKAGDTAAAERVKALAKPSVTAWAVNQVWWAEPARVEALLAAGVAERAAHLALAAGRAADLRAAGEARGRAVAAVAEAALARLGGKKAVAPDLQYRIAGTLEALASSGIPEGERPGRLTRDHQSSGLEALSALAGLAGPPARPTLVARADSSSAPPAADRVVDESAGRARAAAVARAGARVADLEAALAAVSATADAAGRHEADTRQALDEATARRRELEARLDEARSAEAAARRELSSASAAASRAAMDRGRAAKDLERAREALARLQR